MAKHPSVNRVGYNDLAFKYGASDFQDALGDYLATLPSALFSEGREALIPFQRVAVYHKVKFVTNDHSSGTPDIIDAVVARPEQTDSQGRVIPARFDTVLVHSSSRARGEHANRGHSEQFLYF